MASVSPKSLTTHGKGRFVSWPTRPRKYGVADRSTQKLMPRSLLMRSRPRSRRSPPCRTRRRRPRRRADPPRRDPARPSGCGRRDAPRRSGRGCSACRRPRGRGPASPAPCRSRRTARAPRTTRTRLPSLSRSSSLTSSRPAATCRSNSSCVRYRRPRAVVVFGPMVMVSGITSRRPAFDTRALTPPVCVPCGSKTCQLVTSTRPCARSGIRCGGTRSGVR